jgi:hypothetical protein
MRCSGCVWTGKIRSKMLTRAEVDMQSRQSL